MSERKGERIGWLGGWIGAFCWLPVMSLVWLGQGRALYAIAFLILFLGALACIRQCAPWRHPDTRYWWLMLPLYTLFLAAVAVLVNVLTGFSELSRIQYGAWILPCLAPMGILGSWTWRSRA